MRISDWSSDVCSSDLIRHVAPFVTPDRFRVQRAADAAIAIPASPRMPEQVRHDDLVYFFAGAFLAAGFLAAGFFSVASALAAAFAAGAFFGAASFTGASAFALAAGFRSEEHTSELQSLMRISYAVFCFK